MDYCRISYCRISYCRISSYFEQTKGVISKTSRMTPLMCCVCVCVCIFVSWLFLSYCFYERTDGPERRWALWVAVPLVLVVTAAGALIGLVLWLRSHRTHCRLPGRGEARDVTMVKVSSGEDPTYGVRSVTQYNLNMTNAMEQKAVGAGPPTRCLLVCRNCSMSSARQAVGPDCPTWSRGPWLDRSPWPSVSVRPLRSKIHRPHLNTPFLTHSIVCFLTYSMQYNSCNIQVA